MKTSPYHTVHPEWVGRDCFILCGGTSVVPAQVQRLRGRAASHVIAVNSSYAIALWADALFFADDRWWKREVAERPALLDSFKGEMWTTARHCADPRLKLLKQVVPADAVLTTDRQAATVERTSMQAAVNIAVHRGAGRIILIGADNRDGPDGRVHHHGEYPWERKPQTWKWKMDQLEQMAKALADLRIPVINASLISTLTWWPKVDLGAWLDGEDSQ